MRSLPADQEVPDLFVQADVSTAKGVAKLAREALVRPVRGSVRRQRRGLVTESSR